MIVAHQRPSMRLSAMPLRIATITKVSKLERGEQRPSDNDLAEWLEAADASADVFEELGALLAAARIEYATVGQLFRRHGGAVGDQANIRALEARANPSG